MKFYRLHTTYDAGSSLGSQWFTSKGEAERAARLWKKDESADSVETATIETVEVPPTKAGILRALKRYASHPDNG